MARMSTRWSTWSNANPAVVEAGFPYGGARFRRHSRLRRWLVAGAAGCVTVLVVQATVIGSTRAALYNEHEYLYYPSDWLDTIQIDIPQPGPAAVAPAGRAQDGGGLAGGMDLEPLPLDIKQYRVQSGDTLTGIAARFGLSLDTVASLNRSAGVGVHLLAIGELIRIPNQDGIYLPVGDDLDELSLQHGVLPETVLRTNRVDRAAVSASTELFFPGVQHSGRELSLATGAAFARPTRGWVSSRFGPRKDPFTGLRRFHRGVDLASPHGIPVHATQGGRVVAVGYGAQLGTYIIIAHYLSGYSSLYGHLHRIHVTRGETVLRGETIGRVGSTGRSTGPHLHFEIRQGNIQLDPARLIPGLR